MTPSEPFDPPGEPWVRVSPELATLRRWISARVACLLVVAARRGAGLRSCAPWLGGRGRCWSAVALVAWGWVVVGRAVRSWGYAERDDDLLVTSGVLFRQLVVVPYGRMQFVDVTAGPLDRRFGLATVQLHTASAATDAQIPGLRPGRGGAAARPAGRARRGRSRRVL